MKFKPQSFRLSGYDYGQSGSYFITLCTYHRHDLFGEIFDGKMRMNQWGEIVRNEWFNTENIRPNVLLDEIIIMPDHFHGIIELTNNARRGAARRAPTYECFGKPTSGTIPTIVRSFKSAVTNRINKIRNTPGQHVWQRNYYECVIRNKWECNEIRHYIHNNPLTWDKDTNNPENM